MMSEVDMCIEGGTIITVDPERRVIRDGLIALDKGTLTEVGKRLDLKKKYTGRRVIDARGKVVMPGFINAHIHMGSQIHKGFVPEYLYSDTEWAALLFNLKDSISEEEELWAAKGALIETLKNGTTCFADAGLLYPDSTIEGVEALGMRGRFGRWGADQTSEGFKSVPGVHFKRMEESTENLIRTNEELLKKYEKGLGNQRIKPWVTVIGSRYCSDELLKESKRMADRYNTMFYMHQSNYIHDVNRTRQKTGKRPIAYLKDLGVLGPNLLLAHMIRVDDTEIEILREYDVKVVHCPTTALKLVYELSNFGRFPEMMNAGVTVALGSDAPDCSNHHDMLRVLNLEALIYKDLRHDVAAMSAEKVIEMATIQGARAMGLEKEIGSLEKGKRADLIIFDTTGPEWVPMHNEIQNLVYSATGNSVETVIIDGRIVVENKTLKTMDESKVLAKVQELGDQFVRRSGHSIMTPWKIV